MSKFLETYGEALFTLVLVAILIAFAGPLGIKIKNLTTHKVSNASELGRDETTIIMGGTIRPEEPTEAVDKVYCVYYDDGEMTISQNEIKPESKKTVLRKGFFERPSYCTIEMTTVRFIGAVKPKSCKEWFTWKNQGAQLSEIKNIQNLYTNECTDMSYMFNNCTLLTNLDLKNFDISNVTNLSYMFHGCTSLSVDVSRETYEKLMKESTLGISKDKFIILEK